jgi:hypothetical protein
VQELIDDPARTGLVVVALPEEMPTAETTELLEKLPDAVKTPVLLIVANRVIVPPSDREAIPALAGARAELGAAAPAVDAAALSLEIADDQAEHIERLRSLGPPTVTVPLLAWDHHDLAATRRIAGAISS